MKYLIVTLALLVGCVSINAQSTASPTNIDGAALIGQFMSNKVTNPDKVENAEGSKYVSEQFLPIRILNQKENKLFLAKYNAFTGNIEVQELDNKNGDTYVISKDLNDIAIEFTTSGDIYQTFDYINEDNEMKKDFFVTLVNSNRVALLKKQTIEFEPAQEAKSSYEKSKPAKYDRQKDTYYIKIGANNAKELPSNKKSIAKLFPKYESQIKTFIKENRIKTSNEEDLVALVDYIKTL